MPRTEADREDLMAEAVALVRRIELAIPDLDEPVVSGFRRGGEFSVYFGQDPVFHFDRENRLRRAYRDGKLYRTQGETLAELTRIHGDGTTTLVRRDLLPADLAAFLSDMRAELQCVLTAILTGNAVIERQVPDDAELIGDVRDAIVNALNRSALAPQIAGKR